MEETEWCPTEIVLEEANITTTGTIVTKTITGTEIGTSEDEIGITFEETETVAFTGTEVVIVTGKGKSTAASLLEISDTDISFISILYVQRVLL